MKSAERELKLRFMILDKYSSLREFSRQADIPYSTLMTVFNRGISGAGFDLIMKICTKLDVDPSEFCQATEK